MRAPEKAALLRRPERRRLLRLLGRTWPLAIVPAGLALTALCAGHPAAVERLYSRGLYPVLSGFFGRVTGLFPFSLAELTVIGGGLALLGWLGVDGARIIRIREGRGKRAASLLLGLLCAGAAVYGWFVLVCAPNYQRQSFAGYASLSVRPSSSQELRALCEELLERCANLREALNEDADGVAVPAELGFRPMALRAAELMTDAAGEYPVLGGYTPPPKPVFFSRAMSYLNISGIYFPFTFESNVNADIPVHSLPAAMLHELAHYKGFMREQEANFIAYLASNTGDPFFAYSGAMLALTHAANALYAADRDLYFGLAGGYSEGMRRDLQAEHSYWQQFETPVATAATAVNDVYLRANRQESGVKSYGEMVDLLLAEYRMRHGLA